jgi:hypothetical protein
MHPSRPCSLAAVAAIFGFTLAVTPLPAESAPPTTAGELASRMSTLRQNGSTYVRLRMEIKGATNETLQLQIKERRTKGAADVLYQVMWPKERKGESVLLRKSGSRPASGSVFIPPSTVRPINDLKAPLLGSDLAYEDVVEDFFAWDQQAIVGTEDVDRVGCQILESKPGKGERSIYGSVRSWIDVRRLVPLRVEKYSNSGQLLRRIETTRVVSDAGNHIPANLTVSGARSGSTSSLDGSRIKHDMAYTDRDFSAEALKEVITPRGSAE